MPTFFIVPQRLRIDILKFVNDMRKTENIAKICRKDPASNPGRNQRTIMPLPYVLTNELTTQTVNVQLSTDFKRVHIH
jgi:hypothetical protein